MVPWKRKLSKLKLDNMSTKYYLNSVRYKICFHQIRYSKWDRVAKSLPIKILPEECDTQEENSLNHLCTNQDPT